MELKKLKMYICPNNLAIVAYVHLIFESIFGMSSNIRQQNINLIRFIS
jgi:hypothetical protein